MAVEFDVPTCCIIFFFFNDTATTEIYTLSLHDALPIFPQAQEALVERLAQVRIGNPAQAEVTMGPVRDRKSTRLNSSHSQISYAVFCLKKKNKSALTRPDIDLPSHCL